MIQINKYLLLLFLTVNFLTFGQRNWELSNEKNGTKVFSKTNPKRGIKELKSIAVFQNTNLSTIYSVFNDVENTRKWTTDLKISKVLRKVSETENYEYYEVFVPWPLMNRDVIYHINYYFDENENALHLKATSDPTYLASEKNVVRITDSFASWKFTKLGNGNVQVENHLYADPKGFPAWVVNLFTVESPLKVMASLRRFTKLPEHQNKKYDFIKE